MAQLPLARRIAYSAVIFGAFLVLLEGVLALVQPIVLATRHREFEEGKAIGILCLGDSVTWGQGFPKHLSYPGQLLTWLQMSGIEGVEVVNRAISGADTQRLVTYDLDAIRGVDASMRPIVLLMIGHNEVTQWSDWEPKGFAPIANIGEYQRDAPRPAPMPRGVESDRPSGLAGLRLVRAAWWMAGMVKGTPPVPAVGTDLEQRMSDNIMLLVRATREKGGELYLLTYLIPGLPPAGLDPDKADVIQAVHTIQGRGNEIIRNIAQRNDVPLIDLPEEIQVPEQWDPEWFLDHIHPTAAVYGTIAGVVGERLVERGELPPPGAPPR